MTLPELDYKKIVLAILLLVVSVFLIVGVIWLVFVHQPGEPVSPGGEVPGEVPGGGLPEAGGGGGGNIVGPGGTLPGSGGGSLVGDLNDLTGGTGGVVDEVASGSLTKTSGLIDEDVVAVDYRGDSLNYLSGEDNKFYQLSLDGEEKYLLSDEA